MSRGAYRRMALWFGCYLWVVYEVLMAVLSYCIESIRGSDSVSGEELVMIIPR